LDDYQGDGSGRGTGISPEEYRGELIVRISIIATGVSSTSLEYKMLLINFSDEQPFLSNSLPSTCS